MVSTTFHQLVQWATANTWIPDSTDRINLQTNVITQVVNGPVITSISVLFATLISMTFSTLYDRQGQIQESFLLEVTAQRQLEELTEIAVSTKMLPKWAQQKSAKLVQEHGQLLSAEADNPRGKSPHLSRREQKNVPLQSTLQSLLNWCNTMRGRQRNPNSSLESVLAQTTALVENMLHQRAQRHLYAYTSCFPLVHYLTLGLLAVSIAISFLVATDEAEFIFLHGLPVRILWTLLVTSFAALSVVCYDLSAAYSGAYHI